uniref:Protein kinase domain-containing protein n=1 Tax=Nothobranchius furzeri TaxID=105023 RepID=A0A8C6P1P5_NOTFU
MYCRNLSTNQLVTIKTVKLKHPFQVFKEIKMINYLRELSSDENNIIKFIEYFNLLGLMHQRNMKPLSVHNIRAIAQQILVSLGALKEAGITHTNITLENIMLVNQKTQPYRVKLAGFSHALKTKDLDGLSSFNRLCLSYVPPEILLGFQVGEEVDMWSLGCVLAFLFLGRHLHPADDELHALSKMQSFHGNAQKPKDRAELQDIKLFIDLLKQMFRLNPAVRINPADALKHPFFTTNNYLSEAKKLMEGCELRSPNSKTITHPRPSMTPSTHKSIPQTGNGSRNQTSDKKLQQTKIVKSFSKILQRFKSKSSSDSCNGLIPSNLATTLVSRVSGELVPRGNTFNPTSVTQKSKWDLSEPAAQKQEDISSHSMVSDVKSRKRITAVILGLLLVTVAIVLTLP